MESRALRYFVAVAEELNFARAAERLGIAAPPLSRAIRKLEADLDVTLFVRTTHRVELTPAGAVLLNEGRIALDALKAAGRRTQRAAEDQPQLVLAVKADGDGGLLETILAKYAAEPGAIPVAVRLCGWGEQPGLLREGEADVAMIPEPFDRAGLDAETIAVERRLVALPATDPLAAQDDVRMADLELPGTDPGALNHQFAEITGRQGVRDLSQVLKLVELGEFVTLLPESVVERYPRPGIVYREVSDAPPAVLTIAWPQQSRSLAVAALVRVAASL